MMIEQGCASLQRALVMVDGGALLLGTLAESHYAEELVFQPMVGVTGGG